MNKMLKIEAFAGMSGDMFLGALCGLADAYDKIQELPGMLHLEKEVRIDVTDVVKNGIACKHVKIVDRLNENGQPKVSLFDQDQSHDHVHAHEHDHSHSHHSHTHEHDHSHGHSKGHSHQHQSGHHHPHRHLKDINKLIDQGHLSEGAKQRAKDIFLKLGQAESHVHGISLDKIHFHEVGAIDSIMDIVGTAWLLDLLDIGKTYCTPVTTGFGFANTEHGKLPIPCPATQILLHDVPTITGDERGEMTTPTGAAILRHLQPEFEIPVLRESKTSYGPGEKDFIIPNTLRISLCEPASNTSEVTVVQTNIDDLPGEMMGWEFQQELMEAGALDFYFEQVIMKKGRPGTILTVICPPSALKKVSGMIMEKTSTIGIRYFSTKRLELPRKNYEINTSLGRVKVKEVETPSGHKRMKIESSDLFRIAKEKNKNPLEINQIILNELNYEKNR